MAGNQPMCMYLEGAPWGLSNVYLTGGNKSQEGQYLLRASRSAIPTRRLLPSLCAMQGQTAASGEGVSRCAGVCRKALKRQLQVLTLVRV